MLIYLQSCIYPLAWCPETPCHACRSNLLLVDFLEAEVWLLRFGNAWPFRRNDSMVLPATSFHWFSRCDNRRATPCTRFHSRDLLAEEFFAAARCKAMIGIHPSWRDHMTGRTSRPWGIRDWQGQRGRHAGYAGYTYHYHIGIDAHKKNIFFRVSSRPTHEIHLAVWLVHIGTIRLKKRGDMGRMRVPRGYMFVSTLILPKKWIPFNDPWSYQKCFFCCFFLICLKHWMEPVENLF